MAACEKVVLELARAGKEDTDFIPLLDLILNHVPPVPGDPADPLQFQIMNLDYDGYVGSLGIGRVFRGSIKNGENLAVLRADGSTENFRVSKLYGYEGIRRIEIESAVVGDIIAVAGLDDMNIGETICPPVKTEARPPITVDEPTVSMFFLVNDSPFAGREGDY
ncbi:MAG: EF-Tu/IF-2/RF-3 family GTPase, partial [Verrucomicrobiota bacterium]